MPMTEEEVRRAEEAVRKQTDKDIDQVIMHAPLVYLTCYRVLRNADLDFATRSMVLTCLVMARRLIEQESTPLTQITTA